jgi:hypothetical protein
MSEMIETRQNCMEITDFSSATIRRLLQFLYNNEVSLDDSVEEIQKLIEAAEKYQIDKLKVNV